MKARKCDRCGKYYEEYNVKHDANKCNAVMLLNKDEDDKYYTNPTKDLCRNCMRKLYDFLKGGADNEK